MRKLLTFLIALAEVVFAIWSPSFGQTNIVGGGLWGDAKVSGGGGGYVGPGDIVSGASAWWGLRAYSNATKGGNAVDVFGNTTSTTFTFVTKSDGTLELSAGGAAAFIAGNSGVLNMRITQLYDQTGNGHPMTATGVPRPVFLTSGLCSFAVAQFNNSAHIMTAVGFAVSQPLSIAAVAKETSSAGIAALLSDSTNLEFSFNTTPALRVKTSGNLPSGTTPINTFYSLQGVFNGASSVVTVNGTDTTGTIGGNGISGAHVLQMGNDDFGEALPGAIVEQGVWPIAFSSGQRTSMSSNQRAFWGF
jgi:hypothetical protein